MQRHAAAVLGDGAAAAEWAIEELAIWCALTHLDGCSLVLEG